MKEHTLIACIFDDADSAVDAINELRRTGFSDDQQGFVVRHALDEHATNALAREIIRILLAGTSFLLTTAEKNKPEELLQEKLGIGTIVSGLIGGTLGAVAVLRLPDVGLIVAGGNLVATLANIGPGGIVGSLLGIGISGRDVHYYEQKFLAGSIIFALKADEQRQEAQDILRYHRAHSICT